MNDMPRVLKTAARSQVVAPISKDKRTLAVIIVLVVLFLVAAGSAAYFYYQYRHPASVADNNKDEVASLTKKIGAVMELPIDEAPTMATVMDKEKLAEQPFFQKAENGDKVLIYTNSGRAILYRPSTGKIVDVTTVNVNTAEPAAVPQSSEAGAAAMPVAGAPSDTEEKVVVQNVSVAIYNGSTKIDVPNTLEDEIKTKFPDVEVVAKHKAAKNNYQGNLVIDLTGNNTSLAKSLAESLTGTTGILPEGETRPEADILIITGNQE